MKVSGRAVIDAPREAVFATICNPAALLEIIPGCEAIEQGSTGEYRGRIALRLPAIAGVFDLTVRLAEADPPSFGAIQGVVEGRAGTIAGRASFRLAERSDDGSTTIDYDGTAIVSGPLARLDARFVEHLSRSLIDEGLARLASRLEAAPATPGGAA
jgi:carbon monoxide dehydrogenase subunit G